MNKTMSEHIDRGLGLFQNNIADQRFINAVFGFHINKKHFVINRSKTLNLNSDRTAYGSLDNLLIGGFKVEDSKSNKFSILMDVTILPIFLFSFNLIIRLY